MKKFHLGDILSITTDYLVSTRHTEGLRDILNYMTKKDLYDHQLISAAHKCKSFLLKQYPQLKNIDTSTLNPNCWQQWLNKQIQIFGEELEVIPLDKF